MDIKAEIEMHQETVELFKEQCIPTLQKIAEILPGNPEEWSQDHALWQRWKRCGQPAYCG